MEITREEYLAAKYEWNKMKALSTQKNMTDKERSRLRTSFATVQEYEAKNKI